ncbi:MAG: tyrosine-type recombinase/integrase [Thermodesulfobacteriota bacterium]
MAKLTKRFIDSIQPEVQGDTLLWDDDLPGFGLRVKPSGVKSFCIQYRAGGRSRRTTLGTYGRLTPDEARKLARQMLADVARGKDPAEAKAQGRSAPTMKDLAGRYLAEHAQAKKKPASIFRDRRLIERFILPVVGSMKVDAVSRADVSRLHHKVGKDTPIQANRVLAVLSKMMTLAVRWGLRSDAQGNPCRHVERFKENKRERYLSAEELARLGAVLAQVEAEGRENLYAIAAIRLLLLTGARLGEVLGLRWEWVDLERGCVFLPDSKTGRKTIPLGSHAMEILAGLPRAAGNPHVLPGLKLGTHLQDLNGPWRRIRAAADLEGVRLHDLRHTWASLGAASGLSLPLIGAVLGHSEPSTTQRYSHLANDPLKQAADLVDGKVAEALSRPVVKKVVALRPKG